MYFCSFSSIKHSPILAEYSGNNRKEVAMYPHIMLTNSEYKDYFVCEMRDLNAAEIPTDVKLIVFKNGIVTAVFG